MGSNLAEAVRIFQGEKILSTPSFGGEVKPSVPCRRFVACKRSLNGVEVFISAKLLEHSCPHSSPFAARVSRVVAGVGAPGSGSGNV